MNVDFPGEENWGNVLNLKSDRIFFKNSVRPKRMHLHNKSIDKENWIFFDNFLCLCNVEMGIEWKLTSQGKKTEEGNCVFICLFGDVTRNTTRYIGFYGWKYDRTQDCLGPALRLWETFGPNWSSCRVCGVFKPTQQLNLNTIVCTWIRLAWLIFVIFGVVYLYSTVYMVSFGVFYYTISIPNAPSH